MERFVSEATRNDSPPLRTAAQCGLTSKFFRLPAERFLRSRRVIMDEYQESNHNDHNKFAAAGAAANRWLVIAVVALLGIAGVAFAYGLHQQTMVHELTAQAATANAAMSQMQGQLNTVTAKLNELTAAQ